MSSTHLFKYRRDGVLVKPGWGRLSRTEVRAGIFRRGKYGLGGENEIMKCFISATTCFLILLVIAGLLVGCCWLGFTCYELHVWGEPEFENANIYLDNKLIAKSVSGDLFLNIPYNEHEIKVVQKGFKTYTEILEGGPGRRERRLLVKLEPLDSVLAIPSQSDIAKAVK
jgi:hypothetical protein